MTVSSGTDGQKEVSKSEGLTLDRANSIGWYFIESYYELYHKNPESLYKLYHLQASVTHAEIPSVSTFVRRATGTEAIKTLYKDLTAQKIKNKIIIINADIQISLNDNILIIVTGEWSKNGSAYHQFTQTFLLCSGINDLTFDIANDVLRYVDYEFKHELIIEKEKETLPESEDAEKQTPKQETQEVSEPEKAVEPEVKTESKPEKAEPSVKDVKSEKVEKEVERSDEDKSEEFHTPEPEKASGPISWAALAATAKDKSPAEKSPQPKSSKPAAAPATKKGSTSPVALPNGKYKKEDWFPIYVRGCEDVNEEALKEHLTKNFGEIKFFKQNVNIALIDFLNAEGQRKALAAKKTVVNGTTILLEVRESKLGKKDPKKEKESKRKEKKVPAKKK